MYVFEWDVEDAADWFARGIPLQEEVAETSQGTEQPAKVVQEEMGDVAA